MKLLVKVILRVLRRLNKRRPRIFLFTDSRGFNIVHKTYFQKLLGFYPAYFIKRYSVDLFLAPQRHTTIIDFLNRYEQSSQDYDFVIAHVGIVDFSPRHHSVANEKIYRLKKEKYDDVFGGEKMEEYLRLDFGVEYENEKTINMFSLEMAETFLLPRLRRIPNLIWIGCNNFVDGWDGNYFRKRPENIKMVEEYSKLFCENLPTVVDISGWDDDEVMKYTFDNIHLTKKGAKVLLSRIREVVEYIADGSH